jgi:hypothetical protein
MEPTAGTACHLGLSLSKALPPAAAQTIGTQAQPQGTQTHESSDLIHPMSIQFRWRGGAVAVGCRLRLQCKVAP